MAGAVLIGWPMISIILFAVLGPARGLIWSVMIGYLFLPEGIGYDLPGLPPYNKGTAVSLGILLPALAFWHRVDQAPVADPLFQRAVFFCLAVLILSGFGTYDTNPETLFNGPAVRRGLSIRDAVSMATDMVLQLLPFLLAWRFLRQPKHHREVMIAVIALGLAYTFLVLFEIRMSPQLNKWVYGYFSHSWTQHLRGDGFRPIVFLRHGLWVGFFLFSVVIAASAMGRDKKIFAPLMILAGLWCFMVLFLSRNLGATILAILFLPTVFVLSLRAQVRMAALVAILLLGYPALSAMSLTPATKVLELVSTRAPKRAQSFQFRLDNEALLLERARQKPVFGWGGWSRQRVYDERGRDLTLTDGLWIIIIGQRGWVGYLAFFGILCLPVLFLGRAAKRSQISPAIGGMAVIMAGNYIYLIPNSTLSPIGLMMLGCIAAFVLYAADEAKKPGDVAPARAKTQKYSRFPAKQRDEQAGGAALSLRRDRDDAAHYSVRR